ncbi:hypothetical protein [Streptomyces boncukensis]|uniref:hypothetical protein n=1 Tax=Streptomyces boncukensis TaxID=2711219 RepID=UPI0019D11904|nr:hypothetical protein [Streptomyces boncukensis]
MSQPADLVRGDIRERGVAARSGVVDQQSDISGGQGAEDQPEAHADQLLVVRDQHPDRRFDAFAQADQPEAAAPAGRAGVARGQVTATVSGGPAELDRARTAPAPRRPA